MLLSVLGQSDNTVCNLLFLLLHIAFSNELKLPNINYGLNHLVEQGQFLNKKLDEMFTLVFLIIYDRLSLVEILIKLLTINWFNIFPKLPCFFVSDFVVNKVLEYSV